MNNVTEQLPISVKGIVQTGKRLGRKIGFPTVNLSLSEHNGLPYGVYVSCVTAGEIRYMGMTNVGRHPTVPDGAATIETHLLDADIDLYGKEITVELLSFLRPETRFESVEALRRMLEHNLEQTRQWFMSHQD